MKYTERDIEKAIRLRSEGYNWIATNKDGRPFAYGRMPYRCADDDNDRNEYNIWDNQSGTPWLMLSKEYFKSITWENEPVYVDEIIAEGEEQVNEDIEIARLIAENQRLKEEVAEQKSIAEHEHATQMEWFSIAGDYKAENAELKKRLENAMELPCVKLVNPKVRINRIGIVNVIRDWAVVYIDKQGDLVVEHCKSKTAAEARLAELKGAKNDR